MKHKLVLVTDSIGSPDDLSHDSTWYKAGDEEIVYQEPLWPEVAVQRWHSALHAGGINEEHCKVLTGLRAFIKCLLLPYYKRQYAKYVEKKQKEAADKYWGGQVFLMGQRITLQHRKGGIKEMVGGAEHVAYNGSKGVVVSQHGKAGYYVRFDDNPRVYFTCQAIDLRRLV